MFFETKKPNNTPVQGLLATKVLMAKAKIAKVKHKPKKQQKPSP